MFDIYDSGLGGLNDSDFGADADQSFTSGWDQGWDDRNFGVNTNQGPLANYSTKERVYDDWMIKDLLKQGIIAPSEIKDIGKEGYKQVMPIGVTASWIPDHKKGKDYLRNDPYKNQLLFPIGGPFADPWQGKIDYGTNRRGYNGPLRFG